MTTIWWSQRLGGWQLYSNERGGGTNSWIKKLIAPSLKHDFFPYYVGVRLARRKNSKLSLRNSLSFRPKSLYKHESNEAIFRGPAFLFITFAKVRRQSKLTSPALLWSWIYIYDSSAGKTPSRASRLQKRQHGGERRMMFMVLLMIRVATVHKHSVVLLVDIDVGAVLWCSRY